MQKMEPKPRHREALKTWYTLNFFLKNSNYKDTCILLEMERTGLRRKTHLHRIESRISKLSKV